MPKMRLGWYAGVSAALAGSVVLSAFHQRPNFYSAMVYLSQSNFCLLVIINFTLLVYSSMVYGLVRLCFGPLRAVEMEQLTERAWFAITETCLAMTIFRDEIGGWFLIMFTALLTGKIWTWIGDGRVEVLEQQPPSNPRLFHARLCISLALSCLYDMAILRYTVNSVVQTAKATMMVMFLFEFAVLTASSWRTAARYTLTLIELTIVRRQTARRLQERKAEIRQQRENMIREREEAAARGEAAPDDQEPLPSEDDIEEMDIEVPGWAGKGEWVLWLDLLTDMTKLGIYVAFFFMLYFLYALPIHIIRDLFITARDFIKRLGALLRYRRAIREMNRHPDATEEDLNRESTCIICREDMRAWDPANNPGALDRVRPKKLPCGHILHLGCLRSWLERQQVCPTCRTPVTGNPVQPRRDARGPRIQIEGPRQPQPQQQVPQAQPGRQEGSAAQNGPGQNWGNGQPQPQPQPQPPQGNRPRVFNFGPFHLGFGANAEQVRELAQQFGIQTQGPGLAATNTEQPEDGQTGRIQNIGSLLQQAEQMLQRELQSLQVSQQELLTINLLTAELQRLRQRQQNQSQQDQPPVGQPQPGMPAGLPMHALISPNPTSVPSHPVFNASMPTLPPGLSRMHGIGGVVARHGTAPNMGNIPAGSPDLPDGVVIPPGWSLTPLQRLGDPSIPQMFVSPGAPTAPATVPPQRDSHEGDHSDATIVTTASAGRGPRDFDGRLPEAAKAAGPSTQELPQPTLDTASTANPTPMVSAALPPNWGGPAQLFNNNNNNNNNTSLGEHGTPAQVGSHGVISRDGTQNAALTSPTRSPSFGPACLAEADAAEEGSSQKGKGRAATVEEASDDGDG